MAQFLLTISIVCFRDDCVIVYRNIFKLFVASNLFLGVAVA